MLMVRPTNQGSKLLKDTTGMPFLPAHPSSRRQVAASSSCCSVLPSVRNAACSIIWGMAGDCISSGANSNIRRSASANAASTSGDSG